MLITEIALDNIRHHIRVNALCPFFVQTAMLDRALARIPPLGKMIEAASPLNRAALPEEVANVAVFLCSPSASFMNGMGLLIDAGTFLSAHI